MTWLLVLAAVLLCSWAFVRFRLGGRDLSAFDVPVYDPVRDAPSPEHQTVLHMLRDMGRTVEGLKGRRRLHALREVFDHMSDDADLSELDRVLEAADA